GVLVIAVAVALTGCGGDDGGGSGGGGVHPLGEEVTAGYAETTESGARGAETTLGITVLAVRQGSQDELTEGGYETDDKDTTPYYIDVRYENQGDATIKRNIDVSLEDSDGNLISSTLIFNYGGKPFKPCTHITEGKLEPGDSYESCTLFLVPPDVELGKVSFLSDNGADAEPEFIYWDVK
ncbi:MAG: hypothetical protein QOH90_566, partial [Actinomycetota bacterium]|nr:hypothetical protein [Actinomycetota bacterium]